MKRLKAKKPAVRKKADPRKAEVWNELVSKTAVMPSQEQTATLGSLSLAKVRVIADLVVAGFDSGKEWAWSCSTDGDANDD